MRQLGTEEDPEHVCRRRTAGRWRWNLTQDKLSLQNELLFISLGISGLFKPCYLVVWPALSPHRPPPSGEPGQQSEVGSFGGRCSGTERTRSSRCTWSTTQWTDTHCLRRRKHKTHHTRVNTEANLITKASQTCISRYYNFINTYKTWDEILISV